MEVELLCVRVRSSFPNPSTAGIWDWAVLCCGVCPVHVRCQAAVPDPNTLDVTTSCDHPNCLQTLPNAQPQKGGRGAGRQDPPTENH